MTLEQNLRENMLAAPGFTSAVPGGLWGKVPQNPTYPVVQFQRISTPRIYTQDQLSNSRWGGAGWARFQFTAFANDAAAGLDQAQATADAIRAAIKTFDLSQETGAPFLHAPNFVISERAGEIPDTMPPVYTQMLDVRVFFRDQ